MGRAYASIQDARFKGVKGGARSIMQFFLVFIRLKLVKYQNATSFDIPNYIYI